MSKQPAWNESDSKLITTGRVTINGCSAPHEARIFLAKKNLADRERIASRKLEINGLPAVRRKINQTIRARQIFGNAACFWTTDKLTRSCTQLLISEANRTNRIATIALDTKGFEKALETADYWKQVRSIAEQLHSRNATLILQGSHADQTTTAFSDIDLVLLGNPADHKQQMLVSELNQIILAADPFQHHGVFFYDETILDRYSESVLPLATFERATAIAQPVELQFQLLNDKYSAASTLWSNVQNLKRFLLRENTIRGMWDWKFKISQFLLLPALMAAVRGNYPYKGDSFQLVSPMYSYRAWKMIEELTRVRNDWPDNNQIPSDYYVNKQQRINGRLDNDPTPVPESLAIWKNQHFTDAALLFLDETLELTVLK